MFARNPIIYWSLPVGLALVLGFIWGRRKPSLPPPDSSDGVSSKQNSPTNNNIRRNASSPIATGLVAEKATSPDVCKLGKSAPIDINPNRITPTKLTNKEIDRDILKIPVLPEEINATNNYDEDLESPGQLTDSNDSRVGRFSLNARTVKEGNPIVIKANKTPKISPEHSFVEAKYAEQQQTDAQQPLSKEANTNSSGDVSPETKVDAKKALLGKLARSSPTSSLSSIQSKDSGKGSTPPRNDAPITSYEFLVKQELVGTILGRKGAFVREIKKACQANVIIKKHPSKDNLKIACIEGNQNQIDEALKMLRVRLPIKRYPGLTMKQIFIEPSHGRGYFNPNELQLNVSIFLRTFYTRQMQIHHFLLCV